MKYGVNTFIWTASFDRSNLHLLPSIKEHGFDGVEVPLFEPAEFAVADIRRGLEDNELECTCCSILTGGMNVISDDAEVRRKTRVHLADCAKVAAELGAKIDRRAAVFAGRLLPGRRRTDRRMEMGGGMLPGDRRHAGRPWRDDRARTAEPL